MARIDLDGTIAWTLNALAVWRLLLFSTEGAHNMTAAFATTRPTTGAPAA